MCYYLLLKKRKRCNCINETQNNSKIIYFHPVHGEMRIFQLGHLYPYKGNDEMTPLYFSHPFSKWRPSKILYVFPRRSITTRAFPRSHVSRSTGFRAS